MTIRSLMRFNYSILSIAALLGVLGPFRSHAALGESEETAAGDAQQLGGVMKSTQRTTYRVHQILLPSGTELREYVGLDGLVFAVGWTGPALPDLRQALGRYFDVYVGAQKSKRGRGHFEVRQDDLVVQSRGHMRAFSGRAYLPQSLPSGISLDELR
jgi:hypothetical protein